MEYSWWDQYKNQISTLSLIMYTGSRSCFTDEYDFQGPYKNTLFVLYHENDNSYYTSEKAH